MKPKVVSAAETPKDIFEKPEKRFQIQGFRIKI